ncbi:TIGR01777 family oxidoreductase [Sphingosinicella sp. BN140058]|uniref:TIGR01777 family oxidoreductase n=1 Tax=Sphingosinicella sp. BN140058 TaxID=1892855 RepID=UPI0010108E00|nr:TIGR01777 family oxidoreductase [Sphingosinicella sp. BN140058]QAY76378.1 TIGR01777 family protein [Sphingosinicella sp. BN140058]
MTELLWTLVAIQMVMGATDTFLHHEGIERLAWRPSQRRELQLHGIRNLAYGIAFGALGWTVPHGAWAVGLIALLIAETGITLWDFVEEDRTRKLPPSERVLHALLTLNYGAILAFLLPVLIGWAQRDTAIAPVSYGLWSWLCALATVGTFVTGVRDLAAAARTRRLRDGDAARLAIGLAPGRAILVTGGTGFIGRRLVEALVGAGHDVTVLTRSRGSDAALPAPIRIVTDLDQIAADARIDAIVNLAGEPIGNGLWTAAKRARILDSRRAVTAAVGRLIDRLAVTPEVMVSGSAIGWYGLRGAEPLDEGAAGSDCFCRTVCAAWEQAGRNAAAGRARLVILRTGLVLGREGGVLSRMLAPFEFGLGGRFGDGRQVMSWIHRDDLVRLIVRAIADPRFKGVINGTAPGPVDNRAFVRALGRALRRPAILPVPAAPLRLALGGFADELLLGGQHVVPARALALGFRFDYPRIDDALAEIVGKPLAAPRLHIRRRPEAGLLR